MRVSTIRLDFDKEYETIWALGAQCGISDLEAIIEANYLGSDLGLDTISIGVTIGCTCGNSVFLYVGNFAMNLRNPVLSGCSCGYVWWVFFCLCGDQNLCLNVRERGLKVQVELI